MNRRDLISLFQKSIVLTVTVVATFSFASAQDTTSTSKTLQLPEFSISEKLDNIYSKINTQQIDSAVLAQNATTNLSILLSKNSAVTVRAYGVSGLSSVSMRGGNSNHTAVVWNGFNLQDPLNGGFNFSSTTVNFIDEINVQYGGGSTAYGSGAIGGTIHLNNTPIFNKQLNASIQYKLGSFGLKTINTSVGYGGKKIASKLRLYNYSTKNNFDYINVGKIGKPTEKYSNAEMDQYGILHELYFKIKEDQLMSSQFWYQYNFREIPPNSTTSSENIDDTQKDQSYSWAINWNKKGDKIDYEARTGLFYNELNYINSTLQLNTTHKSFRNTSEILAIANLFKTQKITLGINNNYTIGISENFNNQPSLNTTAIYIAPSFTILKKIKLNTSIRDEIYAGDIKPITYSINSKYNFYKNLHLTTSFSKNYRTPTFNDLFWSGGFAKGNPDLEDEYGYSKDVGIEFNYIGKKNTIHSNVSFYHNSINNQIQWIAEGQTWTPKNVKLVETTGVELSFSSNYQINKNFHLLFNFNYTYTAAQTKEKAPNEDDAILYKQLTYIPYYQTNSLLGVVYKKISFNTNIQYVGYQFTRADNLDWVDAYWIADIATSFKTKLKKTTVIFSGKINNVFNTTYEVRQWYPMPGINYEIGIKINLN